ncbi:right-handed parallel beta-helix repeat-containing protein [Microbacterium luteum]|uniref:right-handed parallel beta-helix repeat-containing protein n=1 Tax=Microbacterium luteum TaxID=2782167 RepID=UPI0018897D0A|nr:right-handed parallel beta-helix repeat-containing protein [Microbacterium luteum]
MKAVAEDTDSDFAIHQRATFAAMPSVDIRKFLAPGETLPSNEESDIGPLLQTAVDTLSALAAFAGPRTITFPEGRFKLTTPVIWKTSVGLVGAGRANTVFLPEGSAQLAAMASLDFTGTLDDIVFRDFVIDCSAQVSTPTATIKGFSLRYLQRALFERVTVRESWGTGFGNDFSQDVTYVDCIAIGCGRGGTYRWGAGAGFGIGVGMFPNESSTFINCWSLDNHSSGFFFERLANMLDQTDGRGYTMIGCTARGNFTGINDAGVHGLLVSDCHLTDNEMAGFCLSGSAEAGQPRSGGKDGIVDMCVITRNGGEPGSSGVLLRHAGTGGYTFTNNEITDNVGSGIGSPASARLGAGWRFRGNRIERNSGAGVAIEAQIFTRPEFDGNTVRENGYDEAATYRGGLVIVGDVIEPRIVNNTIQGHFGAGVELLGAESVCASPWIRQNRVTENWGGWLLNEKETLDSSGISDNLTSTSIASMTNLTGNPSFETDITGVVADGNVTNLRRVVGDTPFGGAFLRATTINTNTAGLRVFSRAGDASLGGKVWTLSAWVRCANPNAVLRTAARAYGTGGLTRSWGTTGFRCTTEWQRVHITVVLPASANRLDFTVGADIPGAGTDVDVDGVMITPGTSLWPYFEGTLSGAGEVEPEFTVLTSDAFTGTPGAINPRTSDAALGGAGVAWQFGSGLARFAVTPEFELGPGAEPASAVIGLPTGVAGAAIQVKAVASLADGIVADIYSNRTALNSATHGIGARINATGGVMSARFRTIVASTASLGASSFPVSPGDAVWVGVVDAGTGAVELRINGVTVDTMTYPDALPTQFAAISCGSATDTAWRLDDVIVYEAA